MLQNKVLILFVHKVHTQLMSVVIYFHAR